MMQGKSKNINFLSAARVFLFGARDVWFVVSLPIFFYSIFSDGTVESNQKAFYIIGGFMSTWIILYGIIQANTPKLFLRKNNEKINLVEIGKRWNIFLFLNLLFLTVFILIFNKLILVKIVLFLGLFIYCGIFAINSSIHSYLILRFSNKNRVSLDVGFYYMANATGRLIGTFLSGLTYQLGGLTLSLTTASFMIGVCLCFTHLLKES